MRRSGIVGWFLATAGLCLLTLSAVPVHAEENPFFEQVAVVDPEGDSVAVYMTTDPESKEEAEFAPGTVLDILETVTVEDEESDGSAEWYRVAAADGSRGYVRPETVMTGEAEEAYFQEYIDEEMLYVSTRSEDPAAVYLEPDSSGVIVYQLLDEEVSRVTGMDGEFVIIEGDNDFVGYVSERDVTFSLIEKVVSTREQLVEEALKYVGNPYRWGGENLIKGVDCSGFTMKIYEKFGISLPHSSRAQSRMGKKIRSENLQPGDLIFYGNGGTVSHVAIYIGDGNIVHAANRRSGIKISKWDYWNVITMRRFLE